MAKKKIPPNHDKTRKRSSTKNAKAERSAAGGKIPAARQTERAGATAGCFQEQPKTKLVEQPKHPNVSETNCKALVYQPLVNKNFFRPPLNNTWPAAATVPAGGNTRGGSAWKDCHGCTLHGHKEKSRNSAKSCTVLHVVSCEPTGLDQTREAGSNTTKTPLNITKPFGTIIFGGYTRTVSRLTSSNKIQTSTIWNTGNPKSLNPLPLFKGFLLGVHLICGC